MSDFGTNDKTYFVNCHLGELLDYNDTVLAYDLEQINSPELDEYLLKHNKNVPEINSFM